MTVLAVAVTLAAVPSFAITRYVDDNPFHRRSALTGYAGSGYPVGEFESSRDGDGNHQPGALDWSVDLEHYVARKFSLGLTLNNTTYQDKDDELLETHLSSLGGFLRYVMVTRGGLHPYLRFGVGGQRVQFQDPDARFRSNTAWQIQAGGGLIIMMLDHFAISMQAVYNQGFTENTYIPEADAIVGFDTKFWSFQVGAGIYFP